MENLTLNSSSSTAKTAGLVDVRLHTGNVKTLEVSDSLFRNVNLGVEYAAPVVVSDRNGLPPLFTNVTFTKNTASRCGGIYASQVKVELLNCKFFGNRGITKGTHTFPTLFSKTPQTPTQPETS